MDIEQLRDDAEIIRDETKSGANTAKRVGDMFVDIIDYLSSGRMKITGSVNLAVASGKTTLQNVYNSLDIGGMAFLLVSGSNGLLPSTEKYVTVNSSVRPLFTTDSSLGASVGDVVIVAKVKVSSTTLPIYRILPLNDAKAPNGSFPGAMGLESIWDKQQIDKIPNVEATANNAKAIADDNAFNTAGVWNDNMDTCIYNGFYPWCILGRPAGSKGAFSLSVRRTGTPDFNENYTIQQTCYGREGDEIGQIWKRLIFKKINAAAEYTDWVRIDGGGDNVYQIPGRFSNIPLNSNYSSTSAAQLGDSKKLYDALNSEKIIKDEAYVIIQVEKSVSVDYQYSLIYQTGTSFDLVTVRFNQGGTSYAVIKRENIESVVDRLDSTSKVYALSANQGKVLNDSLHELAGNLERFVVSASEEIDKVKEQISKVYKPKGTKTTFAEVLALTDAKEGDVWNVEQAFTFNGNEYASGTNVVCIKDTAAQLHDESCWDPLGGMIEGILKESDVIDGLYSVSKVNPLSANQGKILNENIEEANQRIEVISNLTNRMDDRLNDAEIELRDIKDELPGKANYYTINAPVGTWKEMYMHGSDLTPYFGTARDFFLSVGTKGTIVVQNSDSHVVDVTIESKVIDGETFYYVYLRQALEDTSGLVIAQLKLEAYEDSNGDIEWSDDGSDIEYSTNMSLFEQYPLEFLEGILMYGVERKKNVSSPEYTRIGNMNLHRSLPIHNKMRGCLLDDDGNVVKYLNAYNWEAEVRDGSMGQVMVELPDCYFKFEEDSTIYRVKLSEFPLPGYKKWDKCYVSAYEAALNRTNRKLSSVVNASEEYRGGDNKAEFDGTYKSLLGMPVTSVNRPNFRGYARNRKSDSTEWNILTYEISKRIVWLYIVEFANNNAQLDFNESPTAEGFKQGGLGVGVTFLNNNNWINLNENRPFIPCGFTDSLGNRTGIVPFTMPKEYNQNDSPFVVNVPRYRGIENLFGHIWKGTDGINVRVSPNIENGGDGLSKVYVCEDLEKFSDNIDDDYRYVGNIARDNGYIKEVFMGEYGEIMPTIISEASATTYFCDYFYTNIPNSETIYWVFIGGSASIMYNGGITDIRASYNIFSTSVFSGTRLCFIPKK